MSQVAAIAYLLPFALFLALGVFESIESLRSYYPWIYTVKIALVALAWWSLRGNYPRPRARGVGMGIAFGVVGLVLWVGLAAESLDRFLPSWLAGTRVAYDPFAEIPSQAGAASFLLVRFFGLALVVPLVEEVVWRGLALRWLVDESFERVPIGTFTPWSFAVVTVLFALVHPEILAALVWGALANGVVYLTKNLWAAIAMHITTNLLLGIYVLKTGKWFLW